MSCQVLYISYQESHFEICCVERIVRDHLVFVLYIGRWWIVGSAWSEREKKASPAEDRTATSYNSDMIELSRQQRMNTDVRRNIFCTVMTSEVQYTFPVITSQLYVKPGLRCHVLRVNKDSLASKYF